MAEYWARRNFQHIDVLDSQDEMLRRGFVADAPTLGLLRTPSHSSSAHILFTRPLIVGAAFSSLGQSSTAEFHPLSPTFPDATHCVLLDKNEEIDYALLKCDEIIGGALRLRAAFPALLDRPSTHFLAYNTEKKQKVVGKGVPGEGDRGGYCTDQVGSNHITEVVTAAGRVSVSDPRVFRLLDTHIWPLSVLYFRDMKQHYFTYLRQYEVDNALTPDGRDIPVNPRSYNGSKAMYVTTGIRDGWLAVKEWFRLHLGRKTQ